MSSWLQKQSNPKLYRQHSSSSIPTSNGGPKPTAQNTKEQKPIIEIYTDWANHYLDKLKGRTKIRDLQTELYDGLVLADVIEAVTNEKVPDVVRKPGKNVNAQIGNIQASLNFLLSKGIQVIDIRASEIHGGSLKAILGLFFPIQGITMTLTMTTTPQQQHGSSIPSPTKKATSGRLTAPTTPTKVPCMSHLKPPKVVKSFEKNQQASQIRAPKILGLGPEQKGIGKRTSSSSGFSSPRSVSSSGSSNMSSDTNFPSPSALRRISEIKPPPPNQPPPASLPTRNGIIPTTKSHLPKSSAIARNSPKRSPKFPRSSDTEIKDYGLIDSKAPYPPHAGGKSFIATPSMRIPPKSITIKQLPVLPPQGCTLPSSTLLTSSSKTCSLPRRRREDSSPGPAAVAVVSPMPCNNKSEILQQPQDISAKERNNSINEDEEDPLKCIEPMKPLGLFTKSPNGPSHHLPFSGSNVVKRNPLSIHQQQEGFLKNKSPRSVAVESGYMSDGGDLIFNASNGSTFEDGYMSEGGMSFYAQSLKQHRQQQQLLQQQQNGGGMYRVIGGRKHVQKSDSSFQTEPVSYNKEYDWKKAMAHNARILSSQEKAMDEYLRRQRAVAKQQLHMNKDSRHRSIGTKEDGRGSSIPGTPVMEPRRNYSSSLERSNKKVYREFERSNAGVASPMSSRKNYSQQPNNKDNALLGSKSLPKGSSSLNYGLMLDRIQQKRQHRPMRSKEIGVVSSSPYSWLQPASTYANSVVDPYSAWNDVSSSEAMGSTESLNSVSSSIQHARANSVTKAKLMMMHHQQKISPGNPHGRNIEKQLNHQSETEYYGIPVRPSATPTSINLNRAKNIPKSKFKSAEDNLSPRPSYIFASSNYGNSNSNNNKNNNNNIIKNEGIKNKSETPLIHAPSKLSKEEQTNCDIIKLKKELDDEHDKVKNLTSPLATNSHVVAAFQQSLTNMSNRLHHLTLTAEQKDSELNDLRQTIDKIRQSGVDVGLISSNHPGDLCRQMSSDSFLSDVSDSEDRPDGKKKSKRSGWLRHSFSKAFSRNHANKIKSKGGSLSDAEDGSITKALYEQEVNNRCSSAASVVQPEIKGSQSSSALDDDAKDGKDLVSQLQRQLMEKDELLTETRV
ncbi:NAV2 [Lepeophtheirus salmonis]|uniref:NAV2 n=1 Tax=Lepeophtheirus salmonis TaxID=72036 RepID=A0A7R8CZ57_LEPSM|nr:NAV2 [Lepeophtheirus salmonis]CAF2973882.1 NAV2 [Lepeophtheirus salmonis]